MFINLKIGIRPKFSYCHLNSGYIEFCWIYPAKLDAYFAAPVFKTTIRVRLTLSTIFNTVDCKKSLMHCTKQGSTI